MCPPPRSVKCSIMLFEVAGEAPQVLLRFLYHNPGIANPCINKSATVCKGVLTGTVRTGAKQKRTLWGLTQISSKV